MPFDSKNTELVELLALLCDGEIGQVEWERLESLLLDDPAAQDLYRRFMALDVELAWRAAGRPAPSRLNPPASAPIPPIIIEASPSLHAASSILYPVGSFVFSYAAAVVIVGIGLLIGWAYQVSIPGFDHREVVDVVQRPVPTDVRPEPEIIFVGRVTDMVDCQWADPKTGTIAYAYVPLGRKYALASGLMEITYDTGAKVILQGPCTYQVESRTSGYLSLGRLTARVETKAEGSWKASIGRRRSAVKSPSSPFPLPPSPLFFVRTPTATVTDLGTEFGVEVDQSGVSMAHVYDGKVELLAVSGDPENTKAIRLGENQSARVVVGKDRVARVVREARQPSPFVRQMPKRVRIKMFNTGVNLKEGDPDPHWQFVARSDDPKFKPRPAVVTEVVGGWLSNQSDRSQWISAVGREPIMPNAVTYTFRTTFDLTGTRPSTAILHGRFVADNHVRAIRLNGRGVPAPRHSYEEFGFFHAFSSDRGFVEGVNVLEIDVENGIPELGTASAPPNPMGLLVELEGSVLSAWPEPSANVHNAKQKQKESKN